MLTEAGHHTRREIFQQPVLWPTTLDRVDAASRQFDLKNRLAGKRILFTGAGTSAYAAHAVAVADRRCLAVPTTDLLLDAERVLANADVLISLARSGNSPESDAVVERAHALRPDLPQFAITCNADSKLTRAKLNGVIFLDPRSNDESLVMTSAFSNLVLAGRGPFEARRGESRGGGLCSPRAKHAGPDSTRPAMPRPRKSTTGS